MRTVKIGLIPSHRVPFGEQWARQMRQRCLAVLHKIEGLDLVVPDENLTEGGLVRSRDDALIALDLFRRERVAGVIVGGMTFGHETSAVGVLIAGLERGTPVLHFATRGAEIAGDGLRASDSWCGQFMITSAMKRRGILYEHIPTCFPEEPVFAAWCARFTRACAARQAFVGARIGQIGARPEEFESVWWDEATMQRDFNQTVVPVDLDEVFSRVDGVSPDGAEAQAVAAEIRAGADVEGLPAEAVATLARYEIALRELAREKSLAAMGVNCWTRLQERFGISACSTLGRLTDSGILCSCEVDIYGAATMLAAYGAALDRVAPHFIDWTELHPALENVWLAWHCGNAPPSACCPGCRACLRDHSILPLESSWGTREFRLKPGPVTCCRLVEYEGEWTMFIGKGEVIETEPYVRGSYGWVRVADVFDWEQKMVDHGIIHHGVLLHDPAVAEALESFCKFLGIKVLRGA